MGMTEYREAVGIIQENEEEADFEGTKPETLKLDRERLAHWIKAGAVPSDTVRTLVDRMPPVEAVADADVSAGAPAKADAAS